MVNSLCVKAPAKLNLHLKVLSKRADGFHSLESIFQTVPLYDELHVKFNRRPESCIVHCNQMDLPVENTLTKAYKGFCRQTGIVQGIDVELTKNIPSGAGMGGGSSDAASLLLALNKMFDEPLAWEQLESIALQVGSDVPFFLSAGCAIVTGRGEIIERISARHDLSYVLVYPEVHSSTAEAYSLIDELKSQNNVVGGPDLACLEAMYGMNPKEWEFINSFTSPLMKKYPEISKALKALGDLDAEFVEMTGSGSVVFGVFTDEKSAKKAYTKLCNEWKWCYCLLSSDSLYC
ncbi:MAG: 4-(cytidine 5'-diphospho)-2-C-methyl-D-erythritol kinase [Treponemataceae bacterium]|nr:4-(cytidine 5'-diphospho)-2-C-methyl-D-erythritol kinase [Treponemataceae bacterium]